MDFKTFTDETEVMDVQDQDAIPLMRSGKNKFVKGVNLVTAIIALLTFVLLGRFGVDTDLTGTVGGGPNDLDSRPTVGTSYGFLLLVVINDELHAYQYQPGASSQSNDVTPIDNPSHRWRRIL